MFKCSNTKISVLYSLSGKLLNRINVIEFNYDLLSNIFDIFSLSNPIKEIMILITKILNQYNLFISSQILLLLIKMKNLIELLNTLGFHIDEPLPAIVMLCLSFLVLLCLSLLNVINICFYLLSIYIVSHDKFLSKIPQKYVFIHKFLIFYKNIRISFIFYEFIILLLCLSIMTYGCYNIVSFYIHIK